jgi:hypothetical protein
MLTNKSQNINWHKMVEDSLKLCSDNGIITRPVIMLTGPGITLPQILSYEDKLSHWSPENGIETLFSFFTPHPGLKLPNFDAMRLLTNNLSLFDHLHLVYLPKTLEFSQINNIIQTYHNLAEITKSQNFNPQINIEMSHQQIFDCFFNEVL